MLSTIRKFVGHTGHHLKS